MLARNLKELREEKNLTQSTVAQAVGVSRSSYAAYETGKSEPTASVLLKLANFFQVKTDDLLSGLVPPPLFRPTKPNARLLDENIRVLTLTIGREQRENVQYVPVAAQAGYVSEHTQPEFIQQLSYFNLPKLDDQVTYRAFDIQGDSMPPIRNGYILIGRYVKCEQDIKSGNRYVLITKSGGVVFKKVIRDSNRQPRLILVSDNPEFTPYSIDLADVLEAWEMVAFVGYPTVYEDMTLVINERLQLIEEKINHLKPA